jgi:membrane-associated PAP2 superfamily phosphatase
MVRGWLLAASAVALVLAAVFAAYPLIDIEIARLFFDREAAAFPIAASEDWGDIRRSLNWLPYIFVLPALFVLLRKVVFPGSPMPIAPSVALFLIGSFIAGPGIATNVVLKDNWGRPRPYQIQQFAGSADFQPWWQPGGACPRNCSFVSGEASQAYWLVAPAMLSPPPVRAAAMGAAIVFGTSVGALRVAFGHHFTSDIILAAVITIAIVIGFYWLLLNPIRRNDARLEKAIERGAIALHKGTSRVVAGAGAALAYGGGALGRAGRRCKNHTATLPPAPDYRPARTAGVSGLAASCRRCLPTPRRGHTRRRAGAARPDRSRQVRGPR